MKYIVFFGYLLFFSYSAIPTLSIPFNCSSYNATTDTCMINSTIMFDPTSYINYTVKNLIIINSSLNCSTDFLFGKCAFQANSSQILIINSSLYFAIIELNGTTLNISNSNLSTNGTIKNGIGRPNECSIFLTDVGIGYAGSGAFCQDLRPNCGKPYGSLDLLLNQTDDKDLALGTGSGQFILDFYGCGGGRVFLNMTVINFDGINIISASGSPQNEPEYDCSKRDSKFHDVLNGGTGGYIYIGARGLITYNSSNDSVKVIAEGGNYCDTIDGKNTKFAGSGGRIIADFNINYIGNMFFYTKGGVNDITVKQQNVNPCRNGASGSLYFSNNNSVVFNNGGFAANTITQIPSNKTFDIIVISNGARGGPEDNNMNGTIKAKSIFINKAYMAYERFNTYLSIEQCDLLSISGAKDNAGGIGPPEQNSKSTSLTINVSHAEFGNNTMIQFGKEFNLTALSAYFNGSIQSYFFDSGLYISSE